MAILYEFGNSQHWYLKGNWEFPPTDAGGGKFLAIPPAPLGVTLTDRWFVVRLISALAKQTWHFGGTIARLYNLPQQTVLSPTGKFQDVPQRLYLNRAVLFGEDQKISAPFDLIWYPPHWLPDARLDLWAYIGPEKDLLFELTGQVEDAQLKTYAKLAAMETKVNLIEERTR